MISGSQEPTPRQLDILHGLALGLTNRQIAFVLDLKHQTVKNHLTEIYDKLLPRRLDGARGRKYRILAIHEAMRRGILDKNDIMRTWPGAGFAGGNLGGVGPPRLIRRRNNEK